MHTQREVRSEGALPRELVALAALLLFTLVAVAGYGVFALHPENLPASDLARRLFTVSFGLFARLHIVLSAAVLLVVLIGRLGTRWMVPFAGICVVAFFAEHVGTGYGIPFGGYAYSGLLGPKIGGRVPALIPLSWFLMALPAWVLARAAMPRPSSRVGRIALGAAWLVAWDLALDPAMSFLTPYWSWQETGPYYGMPWINLAGWYATGLVLMVVLESSARRAGWERLNPAWMGGYYAIVLLMPFGMLLAAGAWPAVVMTLVGVGALTAGSAAVSTRSRPALRSLPAGVAEA